MTILALGIALLAGISFLLGWYFRRAERGAIKALPVWNRLNSNLNRFVADESIPSDLARDVTIFAAMAGCGCVAGNLVIHMGRKSTSERYRKAAESEPTPANLRALGSSQKQLLASILRDLIRIDFLRSPILRLAMSSSLKTSLQLSEDGQHHSQVKQIQSLMSAAHDVAERKLRNHRLPNQAVVEPLKELAA